MERAQALRKIVQTLKQFVRGNSNLRVVYCHYFVPDPNPEEVCAIDETVQWVSGAPEEKPLKAGVVLNPGAAVCIGRHRRKRIEGRRETNVGFARPFTTDKLLF
ncbi:MAG TPA: hypothetical protein VFR21_15375 [Bradyrhizobium sp.]|nr:hypothetical protein [Bradyrhizobium sp.]